MESYLKKDMRFILNLWIKKLLIVNRRRLNNACYSIFLYNRISYGSYSPYLLPLKDIERREFILLLNLLIPTLILGIFLNLVLTSLHFSVSQILYYL